MIVRNPTPQAPTARQPAVNHNPRSNSWVQRLFSGMLDVNYF